MQVPVESSCISCIRLKSKGSDPSCKAFPNGIPEEILNGSHDHRKPFKGDNGIRYKSVLSQFGLSDEDNIPEELRFSKQTQARG